MCACVSQTRTHVEHEDIEGEAAAFVVVDDLEHVGGVEVEPVRAIVVQSDVCACVRARACMCACACLCAWVGCGRCDVR